MMKLAVIVPVYKVEQYLRRCVDSILAQTYREFELVLVDDGSPDNCGRICDEYAAADSRVVVIHQANGGLSAARNAGLDWVLAHSAAAAITFVDSDDYVLPTYLEQLRRGLEFNVDVACVKIAVVKGGAELPPVTTEDCAVELVDAERYWVDEDAHNAAWGKLYRRELLKSLRFPVGLLHEDEYVTYRLVFYRSQVAATAAPLYVYCLREGGITADWDERRTDSFGGLVGQCRFFAERGMSLALGDAVWRLEYVAYLTLPHWTELSAARRKYVRQQLAKVKHAWMLPASRYPQLWKLRHPRGWRWLPRLFRGWDFLARRGLGGGIGWLVRTRILRPRRRVCFLQTGWTDRPSGGYKVIFEYANRLAARGWEVSILYAHDGRYVGFGRLLLSVVRHPRFWYRRHLEFLKARRAWTGKIEWFALSPKVKQELIPWLAPWTLWRRGVRTRFVATFISTAMALERAWGLRKFHLVQDFENWLGFTREDVERTYGFADIRKLAVSNWLEQCVRRVDDNVVCIPNGLDFESFHLVNPIASRPAATVVFMWHEDRRKRLDVALKALDEVRVRHPELKVTAFSAFDRPADFPEWIAFEKRPSRARHNEIYNQAAIFVASSEQEGWGLTPCEAMQCGVAVACTECGGYRNFAEAGKTALMSPVNDAAALADNVCRLIEDTELRIRIAQAGHANIRQFTWERAVAAMERELE